MTLINTDIKDENGNIMKIDPVLKDNLDDIKKLIRKDRDYIFAVDGYEGSGKSCFAFQLARYVDPSFELSRICFSAEEFAKQVMGSKKYTGIVYDEARSGLNARRAMSSINVTLTNMLAEIRQRNLFVFIVIPSAYDLDKNIALWRCRGLFHVFEINGDRGYFSYYGREKKKVLWTFYKKLYSYPTSQINFHGQFRDFYTIPEKAYRDKKASALKNYEALLVVPKQVEEKEARRKVTKQVVDSLTARGMSKKEIAEVLGISLAMLRSDLKKIEMGVPPEAIENDEE